VSSQITYMGQDTGLTMLNAMAHVTRIGTKLRWVQKGHSKDFFLGHKSPRFLGCKEAVRLREQNAETLDLHLGETVLPGDDVGGDTILAVVEENDHSVGVHGLASVKLVVLEVGQ
jgi:hypothetical protein